MPKRDPTEPMRTATRTRAARPLAMLAAAMLALAGCGQGDETSPRPTARSESSPPGQPALPTPADGSNLAACRDGRCEVGVNASMKIPVPRKLRVDSVQVQSVGADSVTIVGRYLGGRQGGYCTGANCSSSGSGKRFRLILGPNSMGTENGLGVTAVAINGGVAVLRLNPV
ncbi:MAG: hypothetical protein J2P17_16325 [Mycobacterium sp.]|nr:hypothetical protein [Mycobacterium sp.]